MIVDENQEVREKAIDLIIISARNTMNNNILRRFIKPKREQINESAVYTKKFNI